MATTKVTPVFVSKAKFAVLTNELVDLFITGKPGGLKKSWPGTGESIHWLVGAVRKLRPTCEEEHFRNIVEMLLQRAGVELNPGPPLYEPHGLAGVIQSVTDLHGRTLGQAVREGWNHRQVCQVMRNSVNARPDETLGQAYRRYVIRRAYLFMAWFTLTVRFLFGTDVGAAILVMLEILLLRSGIHPNPGPVVEDRVFVAVSNPGGKDLILRLLAIGGVEQNPGPQKGAGDEEGRADSRIQCFSCGGMGHKSNHCPKKKVEEGQPEGKRRFSPGVVQDMIGLLGVCVCCANEQYVQGEGKVCSVCKHLFSAHKHPGENSSEDEGSEGVEEGSSVGAAEATDDSGNHVSSSYIPPPGKEKLEKKKKKTDGEEEDPIDVNVVPIVSGAHLTDELLNAGRHETNRLLNLNQDFSLSPVQEVKQVVYDNRVPINRGPNVIQQRVEIAVVRYDEPVSKNEYYAHYSNWENLPRQRLERIYYRAKREMDRQWAILTADPHRKVFAYLAFFAPLVAVALKPLLTALIFLLSEPTLFNWVSASMNLDSEMLLCVILGLVVIPMVSFLSYRSPHGALVSGASVLGWVVCTVAWGFIPGLDFLVHLVFIPFYTLGVFMWLIATLSLAVICIVYRIVLLVWAVCSWPVMFYVGGAVTPQASWDLVFLCG